MKRKKKKQRKNIEEFGPDIENAFRFAYKCSYSDVIYFKVTIVGSVYPNFFFVLWPYLIKANLQSDMGFGEIIMMEKYLLCILLNTSEKVIVNGFTAHA